MFNNYFFPPPNTTSLIQPLDQGIIATFKKYYIKTTYKFILNKLENESLTVKDVWKQFSIFDCLIHVASASAQIRPRTLNACWKKIWPTYVTDNTTTQISTLSDEIIILAHEIGGDGFNTFSHDNIDELPVDDALSDNDIIDLTLDLYITVDSVVGLEERRAYLGCCGNGGLEIPSKAKIIDLKKLIESSAVYKNDIEFVRSLVENALEKSKQEAEKNEREAEIQLEKIKLSQIEREAEIQLEKIKLSQIEKQLELAKVRKESEKNSQSLESGDPSSITDKLESLVKSIKTLTIQVPVRSESFNLFFHSLEKAFQIKSVPDELKAKILLNILGDRVNNLLTYVSQ
ncbi:integrase catalytic domain-containing protein [Trichonephila clavipes]|nr:integrase catalytic domain-containing protein [Trichonephila clavipes]